MHHVDPTVAPPKRLRKRVIVRHIVFVRVNDRASIVELPNRVLAFQNTAKSRADLFKSRADLSKHGQIACWKLFHIIYE